MKRHVVESFGKFSFAAVSSAIMLGYLLASSAQSAPLTIQKLTSVPAVMPVAAGSDAAKGEQLFTANCAACHQATGEGVPSAFPALKGNAVVNNANPAAHIHAVLFGLEGPLLTGLNMIVPCPNSVLRLAIPTSQILSITSAVPGAITANS